VAVAALLGCGGGEARVQAQRISDAGALLSGQDATGGIGDWRLSNDRVVAIIDDVRHQNHLAPTGGTLIDFATRAGGQDALPQVYQIFLYSQRLPLAYDHIEAHVDGDTASIVVTGHVYIAGDDAPLTQAVADRLTARTEYTLRHGDPALYVRTELGNGGAEPVSGTATIIDLWLWGNRSAQPFAPFRGRGFSHPPPDPNNLLGSLGTYLFVGAHGDAGPAVTYGAVAPTLSDGLLYGINSGNFSALGPSPFSTPSLAPGESVVFERQFLVADGLGVETVARQAFRILSAAGNAAVPAVGHLAGRLTGVVSPRPTSVVAQLPATSAGVKPMNAARVGRDGGYYLTVPVGAYELVVTTGNTTLPIRGPFEVIANRVTAVPEVALPALATLAFAITSDGAARPARLTLRGAGNADPCLGPPFSGAASNNVVYSLDGTGEVALEPGTYDVYASRGLEYSLAHERISVDAGQTASVNLALSRVLDTTGLVSGDFHVHSGASLDSSIEATTRVLTFAGEGVEVLVSTDHDTLTDLGPAVASLGLAGQMTSLVGLEATGFVPVPGSLPHTIGHNNGWPFVPRPGQPRNGAPDDEGIEPAELYERMRSLAGVGSVPVIQLNHPRDNFIGNVGMGYFDNFGFNPNVPVPDAGDTGGPHGFLRRKSAQGHDNLSFDAMEVVNGVGLDGTLRAAMMRDDWFALLKQGILRTGMANSDSHAVSSDPPGFPRSYVAYAADTPVDLDVEAFDAAIRAHHVTGTNGPLVSLKAGSAGIGDTLATGAPGPATVPVQVQVQAAPWIPVDEVRVWVNGDLACAIRRGGVTGLQAAACPAALAANPADPFGTAGVLRYTGTLQLAFAKDSFVVVEAGVVLPPGRDLNGDGATDTWDCNGDGNIDGEDADPCAALRAAPPGASRPGLPADSPLNPPPLVHAVVPGMTPWGFTNPLFVHLGASGEVWVPPGL
jgi:hypothetical protein